MPKNNRWHVTPRDDGWAVVRENSERDSAHTSTQREAIQEARRIARNNEDGGEVVIHNRDNIIRDSDTVGGANDPCPPKDTR